MTAPPTFAPGAALTLTVTTPLRIVIADQTVAAIRAEDASGSFGILPGHADFLTVIDAGVLRWRDLASDHDKDYRQPGPDDGRWQFAALRGGVMTVTGGRTVAIACREAILGDDLASLQARVAQTRAAQTDSARHARSHDAQLHSRAMRRLMQQLRAGRELSPALIGDEPL